MNTVPAGTAVSTDEAAQAALSDLAANYGTSEVVVAEASMTGDSLQVTVARRGGPVASESLRGTYERQGRDDAELDEGGRRGHAEFPCRSVETSDHCA